MVQLSQYNIRFDQGTLLLDANEAQSHHPDQIEKIFGADIWTWDPRVSIWRCAALHYRHVIMALWNLRHQQVSFDDQARQWNEVEWEKRSIHDPRPEQTAAIQAWLETKRGVVVMPTGTGKTEVALHLLAQTNCSTLTRIFHRLF